MFWGIIAGMYIGNAILLLGPDHPEVGASLDNLAFLYFAQDIKMSGNRML